MMHPSDQWFRIYVYTDATGQLAEAAAGGSPSFVSLPPTWGPAAKTMHLPHPDSWHPDPRVRMKHNAVVMRSGVAVAACGLEHDPRVRFVEAHDEVDRCAGCAKAAFVAQETHAEALAALREQAKDDETKG